VQPAVKRIAASGITLTAEPRHIQQLRGSNLYYAMLKKYLGPQAADMQKAAGQ
jgi:hypothetical protein